LIVALHNAPVVSAIITPLHAFLASPSFEFVAKFYIIIAVFPVVGTPAQGCNCKDEKYENCFENH
jgi:hypothetical protein